MDPVLVPSGYRPPSGCGCFPHQMSESRSTVPSVSTDYSVIGQSHVNANSHILHSILSMKSSPQESNCGPIHPPSTSRRCANSPKQQIAGAEPCLAALGVPTPPPSQPGSPNPSLLNHPRLHGAASPQQPVHSPVHMRMSPKHFTTRTSSPSGIGHEPIYQRVVGEQPSSLRHLQQQQQQQQYNHQQQQQQQKPATPRQKSCTPPALIHYSEIPYFQQLESTFNQQQKTPTQFEQSEEQFTNNQSSKRKHSAISGDQPIDLSCPKRARGETGSVALTLKPHPQQLQQHQQQPQLYCNEGRYSDANSKDIDTSSILKSILCGQVCSSSSSAHPDSENRTHSPQVHALSSCHGLVRSPQERVAEMIDRARAQAAKLSRPKVSPNPTNCSASSPVRNTSPQVFNNHDTVVQLAKKNLLPVSARISDWLVKMIQFAKSLPEFASLAHNDKVILIHNSWARLLLLYMAETNFQFAVTPLGITNDKPKPPESGVSVTPPPTSEEPTVRSIEEIQGFIRKCQMIGVTSEEISFLRLLSLFNPGYLGIEIPVYIENVNAYVRHSFQEYCTQNATNSGKTATSGKLRYSQLLLTLPSLFGISPKVMESLFCRHVSANTDMEVLLKEMLQKL